MSEIDISVIVPCFNEMGNIEALAARVQKALTPLGGKFEMICIDDGSRDGTKEAIEKASEKYDFLIGAFHQENRGIVEGWITGLRLARGKWVVSIDADLQYRPEDIPALIDRMASGDVDLVQGWRKTQVNRRAFRKILTICFSAVLTFIFGVKLKDAKSGFILCKKKVFEEVLRGKDEFAHFQHFITIAALAEGYKIAQIPVTFYPRSFGQSYIRKPLVFALRSAMDIPKALWKYRFNKPCSELKFQSDRRGKRKKL